MLYVLAHYVSLLLSVEVSLIENMYRTFLDLKGKILKT